MNSIEFKGVSSTTIDGLLICEMPPISKPPMRVMETMVDGRHGSIFEDLGYSAYDKSVLIGLHGAFDIDKVIKFFSGEGDIVFGNEPNKVYHGKVIGQIDYNRLLRFRQATVTFRVQPFKHKNREAYVEAPTAMVSGTSLVLTDNANANLKSFRIFGKSTQNGTPTPTAPIDIVSIAEDGDIGVTINDASVALKIANGLKAIPVTDASLATYTDASGQMWCADEIDLKRGVRIERTRKITFTGAEAIASLNLISTATYYRYNFKLASPYIANVPNAKIYDGLCSHYGKSSADDGYNAKGLNTTSIQYADINFYVEYSTIDDFKSFLAEQYDNGTPVEVLYRLATPIETTLTEAEILAYKSLLNEPVTTTSNGENATMAVEYFKPYEVFNEGLEPSRPLMVLKGSGKVEMFVNGALVFEYTFPSGENEVVIDSEAEDAHLNGILKNRNMLGEFPELVPKTNKIEWIGDVTSIEILPRSRWL